MRECWQCHLTSYWMFIVQSCILSIGGDQSIWLDLFVDNHIDTWFLFPMASNRIELSHHWSAVVLSLTHSLICSLFFSFFLFSFRLDSIVIIWSYPPHIINNIFGTIIIRNLYHCFIKPINTHVQESTTFFFWFDCTLAINALLVKLPSIDLGLGFSLLVFTQKLSPYDHGLSRSSHQSVLIVFVCV